MNPDLLLHHQGSLTSLRAIAQTAGAAGAAALLLLPGLAVQGPPGCTGAREGPAGSLEPKRASTGYSTVVVFI